MTLLELIEDMDKGFQSESLIRNAPYKDKLEAELYLLKIQNNLMRNTLEMARDISSEKEGIMVSHKEKLETIHSLTRSCIELL